MLKTLHQVTVVLVVTSGTVTQCVFEGCARAITRAGSSSDRIAAGEAASGHVLQLVTAAEMSKIFGKALTAEQIDGTTGQGACQYSPAEGTMPHVELNIERGAAEAQAIAAGMLNRAEKGMVNRFEGIGDSAVSIGPMLYIRRGEDLISLMIFGADDVAVAARSIYAIASARLPAVDPTSASESASARAEASKALADALGTSAPGGSALGGAADFIKALGALSGDSAVAGLPVDPRSKDPHATAVSPGSSVPLEKAEHIPLMQGLTITGAVTNADGELRAHPPDHRRPAGRLRHGRVRRRRANHQRPPAQSR